MSELKESAIRDPGRSRESAGPDRVRWWSFAPLARSSDPLPLTNKKPRRVPGFLSESSARPAEIGTLLTLLFFRRLRHSRALRLTRRSSFPPIWSCREAWLSPDVGVFGTLKSLVISHPPFVVQVAKSSATSEQCQTDRRPETAKPRDLQRDRFRSRQTQRRIAPRVIDRFGLYLLLPQDRSALADDQFMGKTLAKSKAMTSTRPWCCSRPSEPECQVLPFASSTRAARRRGCSGSRLNRLWRGC